MSRSIADEFIQTMAELRAIDPDNDEPMRHVMRMIRSQAEQMIADTLRHASALAYNARQLPRDCADAGKEAAEKQKGTAA